MRTRVICLLAVAAIALGVLSPYLTDLALDDQLRRIPIVYDSFYLLPGVLNHWLEPEGNTAFMALWMAVCALQYLMVFAVLWASLRFATCLHHFIRPHRHRAGLIRSAA